MSAYTPRATTSAPSRLYSDSLFTVGTNGELYEERFLCTNNNGACQGGFSLNGIHSDGNDGTTLLDDTTDSVAASWWPDTNNDWMTAYSATTSDVQANYVYSDYVWSYQPAWDSFIVGATNWGSDKLFKGHQTVVRIPGSSVDEVYGACRDTAGAYYLCVMTQGFGGSSSWTFFTAF